MKRKGRSWLPDRTIRAQFTLASTLIAALSIMVATGISLYIYAGSAREGLNRELNAVATVVGSNASAALLFADSAAATEMLRALRFKPAIVTASILQADGEVFANYAANPSAPTQMGDDLVFVERTIIHDGEVVGSIRIIASLTDVRKQQKKFLWLAVAITLASAFFAFILSTLIQKAMLRPMLNLVSTMHEVSEQRDYSLRARMGANDEVGRLISGFNAMLERIENQHKELEQYRRDLEGLVQKRTVELSNSNQQLKITVLELREAKAKVEAASKAKSEFLANMSHELRTPLNAIIGFSEIMLNETFGPLGSGQYKEYSEDICASGHHLLAVISDILDMTKIEVGKFTLNESMVSVSLLLKDVYRLIRPSAEKRAIDFPPPRNSCGDTVLKCDPTRVRQILLNVLSNAVKFTNSGGTVALGANMEGGAIIFEIRDSGIGIARADLQHILEPFGQVEAAYSRNHDGVGLGLSLSRGLIRAHGGDIYIASKVGKGTRVSVVIPAARVVPSRQAV